MSSREFTAQSVQVQFLQQAETNQESFGTELLLTGHGTRLHSVSRGHRDGSRPCRSAGALSISLHTLLSLGLAACRDPLHSTDPPQLQNRTPVTRLASQDKLLKSSLLIRSHLLAKEKKKVFPRAKSCIFTLRIPKTVKSEATLQHKGSMLLEAEQSSPGDIPTWWDAPGCLHT